MLKTWGVIKSEQEISCSDIPEYLLKNYPSKCFYVDFFPEVINKENAYKHDQIEEKVYNLEYDRMYNVLLKLWVYDNLYFESELLHDNVSLKKVPLLQTFKRLKLSKKLNTALIDNEKNLYSLMNLSRKNVIDLVFVFEELHIVIVPFWACFFMFIENDYKSSFIKEIVNLEGLHIRKA